MNDSPHTIDLYFEQSQLTIDDVSDRSGLPLDRVEAIALGRWTPSPTEREKIAAAFEVEIDQVAWGHNMDPRNIRYRREGFQRPS
jgi:hypothetical protein